MTIRTIFFHFFIAPNFKCKEKKIKNKKLTTSLITRKRGHIAGVQLNGTFSFVRNKRKKNGERKRREEKVMIIYVM